MAHVALFVVSYVRHVARLSTLRRLLSTVEDADVFLTVSHSHEMTRAVEELLSSVPANVHVVRVRAGVQRTQAEGWFTILTSVEFANWVADHPSPYVTTADDDDLLTVGRSACLREWLVDKPRTNFVGAFRALDIDDELASPIVHERAGCCLLVEIASQVYSLDVFARAFTLEMSRQALSRGTFDLGLSWVIRRMCEAVRLDRCLYVHTLSSLPRDWQTHLRNGNDRIIFDADYRERVLRLHAVAGLSALTDRIRDVMAYEGVTEYSEDVDGRELDIYAQPIKELSDVCSDLLYGLRSLSVRGCVNFRFLPSHIDGLQSLTRLVVNGCAIEQLCGAVADLFALEMLDVGGNALMSLPDLDQLQRLATLRVSSNKLTSLPTLPDSLFTLDVCDNMLTGLPTLPRSLVILRASRNRMRKLSSDVFGACEQLTVVHLDDNVLTEVPIALQDVPTLMELRVGGNEFAGDAPACVGACVATSTPGYYVARAGV